MLCQSLVAPNLKTDHVTLFFPLSFHSQELQRNESGLIRDISIPEQAASHNISGYLSLSDLRATANRRMTPVCTSESPATEETALLPLLSLAQLVFAWFISASEHGKWGAERQKRSLLCWRWLSGSRMSGDNNLHIRKLSPFGRKRFNGHWHLVFFH